MGLMGVAKRSIWMALKTFRAELRTEPPLFPALFLGDIRFSAIVADANTAFSVLFKHVFPDC